MLNYLYHKYPERDWSIRHLVENPNFDNSLLASDIYDVVNDVNEVLNDALSITSVKNVLSSRKLIDVSRFSKMNKFILYDLNWCTLITLYPIRDVLDNLQLPWSRYLVHLSENKYVTMSDVLENPQIPWSWPLLSKVLKWSDVLEYPNMPWSWSSLSENPNITIKIILENPDRPWSYEFVSSNPNLCGSVENSEDFDLILKFIEDHIDEIDFYHLSKNIALQRHVSDIVKNQHILTHPSDSCERSCESSCESSCERSFKKVKCTNDR